MSLRGFESLAQYTYSPIPRTTRNVRVLRFLPLRKGFLPGFPGTLHIEIIEIDLDSDYCYDALSYCWDVPKGQTEPDRRVIVESPSGPSELRIFKTLEVALWTLRSNNRPMFVDQICINQNDNREKEHQVGLMQTVYSKCAQAIIWLGCGTRLSDQYFSYMTKITSEGILSRAIGPRVGQFKNVWDAVMDPTRSVTDSEREDRDDILDLIVRYGLEFPLDGIMDVMGRKWFSRLWTIQEVCLPAQIVFKCGDWELCYDCFRSSLLFFHLYNNHWQVNITRSVAKSEYKKRMDIQGLTAVLTRIHSERKAIHDRGHRLSFYDVIMQFNVNDEEDKIGASLSADRVFGLLGLVAEDDELRKQVKIDYQVGVARVYTDVAALLMKHSTDVLLFSQFPKQLDGLPSWVPDLSMNLKLPPSYIMLKSAVFSAGGSMEKQNIEYDETKGELKLRGIVLDTVSRVGQQVLSKDPEKDITDQVDYISASRFFNEAATFVQDVSQSAEPDSLLKDKDSELQVLRLGDGALTLNKLVKDWGYEEGVRLMRVCHTSIGNLGAGLIRDQEVVASSQITYLAQAGHVPWYAQSVSEWEIVGMLARQPKRLAQLFITGAAQFLVDIVSLCVASRGVPLIPFYLRMKRKLSSAQIYSGKERERVGQTLGKTLEKVGVDPEVTNHMLAGTLCSNLFKNIDRRLYVTEKKHIGLGPSRMRVGDSVVFFLGGTVPHILRPYEQSGGAAKGGWLYIGEAYCDGMMDGEIFNQTELKASVITLV